MLAPLLLAALVAQASDVEVGVGGGLTATTTGFTYSLYTGAGPAVFARASIGDFFLSATTDYAIMPLDIYTGPSGPFIVSGGLRGAFSAAATLIAGYCFRVDDVWDARVGAGAAPTFTLSVSGDSGGGGFYLAAAAMASVSARLSPAFALEASLTTSLAPRSFAPLEYFAVRPALVLSAVFAFGR